MSANEGTEATVGSPLPAFQGRTADGKTLGRDALLGHPAVVYFYPKAGSLGCSLESREFARLHEKFVAAGARIVGISVDPADAQQRFQESCHLPFELIADQDGAICRAFGVLGALRMASRTTFVVDARGTIVQVIRTWRPGKHAEAALASVLASTTTAPGTATRPPETDHP